MSMAGISFGWRGGRKGNDFSMCLISSPLSLFPFFPSFFFPSSFFSLFFNARQRLCSRILSLHLSFPSSCSLPPPIPPPAIVMIMMTTRVGVCSCTRNDLTSHSIPHLTGQFCPHSIFLAYPPSPPLLPNPRGALPFPVHTHTSICLLPYVLLYMARGYPYLGRALHDQSRDSRARSRVLIRFLLLLLESNLLDLQCRLDAPRLFT